MVLHRMLVVAVFVGSVSTVSADDVEVRGSGNSYKAAIETKVADKPVKMVLTGTALRKRAFFSVYTIGSYVEAGAAVNTPEELAAKDCPKQLHLIMERDVGGRDMADAFVSAIRQNYPEPKFAAELKTLSDFMQAQTVKKGDHVWLTHVPKVGLHCNLVGKTDVQIKDVAFSQAVWEIYLGKKNIGDAIKKGLVSRLEEKK